MSTQSTRAYAQDRYEWRLPNGDLHREDGPAVIYFDGGEEWWLNGCRHREDGPAIAFKCGYRVWYKHGTPHRLCGPARTQPCGAFHARGRCLGPSQGYAHKIEYYVDGRPFTEDEYYRYVDVVNREVLVPPGKCLKHERHSQQYS